MTYHTYLTLCPHITNVCQCAYFTTNTITITTLTKYKQYRYFSLFASPTGRMYDFGHTYFIFETEYLLDTLFS